MVAGIGMANHQLGNHSHLQLPHQLDGRVLSTGDERAEPEVAGARRLPRRLNRTQDLPMRHRETTDGPEHRSRAQRRSWVLVHLSRRVPLQPCQLPEDGRLGGDQREVLGVHDQLQQQVDACGLQSSSRESHPHGGRARGCDAPFRECLFSRPYSKSGSWKKVALCGGAGPARADCRQAAAGQGRSSPRPASTAQWRPARAGPARTLPTRPGRSDCKRHDPRSSGTSCWVIVHTMGAVTCWSARPAPPSSPRPTHPRPRRRSPCIPQDPKSTCRLGALHELVC